MAAEQGGEPALDPHGIIAAGAQKRRGSE